MEIIRILSDKTINASPVVALGNFDGVHLGHQEVIKTAVKIAKDTGKQSAVLTFNPNPAAIFRPDSFRAICDVETKYEIIKSMGIDYLFEIHFDKKFANYSPEEFVQNILKDQIHVSHLVTGYNFHFGKNKAGDCSAMQKLAQGSGFEYSIIRQVAVDSYQVSSSLIRSLISSGRMQLASKLLGRRYGIKGEVVRGNGMALSKLGFATANMKFDELLLKPMHGVYFVKVLIGDIEKFGVANFGIRPSVGKGQEVLEVHIMDFKDDIYGTKIELEFITFMRPEVKFKDLLELKTQIAKDVVDADYLSRNSIRLL